MLGFLFGVGITLYIGSRFRRGGFRGARRFTSSRRRRRREWVLGRLASRLDTTAAQERALGDVIDDLFDVFSAERKAMGDARKATADALRADSFADGDLDPIRDGWRASIDRISAALESAIGTAHDVLDDDQRAELADLVKDGPGHCHGRRRGHLRAA